MKRTFLSAAIAIAFVLAAVDARAEEITVTVKGMVCSFCAQGLKKTFGRNEKVEHIDVDLDKKLVIIKTKAQTTISDDELRGAINDAGYDVLLIERGEHA